MVIIGVDYHPSDQYIAFVDTETGESSERRLNHSDGEARGRQCKGPTKAKQDTRRSEWRRVFRKALTQPTLLEMSGYPVDVITKPASQRPE